jgi:hypothetical protein
MPTSFLNRRLLYSGNANLTDKSEVNEEFCFRMVGPVVRQVLETLALHRQRHTLWDGL